MEKISNILWGVIFVALGVVLGLNSLEITDINLFFDGWWTLLIIIPCFIDLFKSKDKTGNIVGIIVGVTLLLACWKVIDFEIVWKLLVPVILIVFGFSFIFKDLLNNNLKREISKINKSVSNSIDDYWATFGSQDIKVDSDDFKGCNVNAIFGGIKLDLSEIDKYDSESVVINVTAIFGGVDILVPDKVKLKIKATPIFGGIEDVRKKIELSKEDKVITIYINALCIFGGVDIK